MSSIRDSAHSFCYIEASLLQIEHMLLIAKRCFNNNVAKRSICIIKANTSHPLLLADFKDLIIILYEYIDKMTIEKYCSAYYDSHDKFVIKPYYRHTSHTLGEG